MSQRPKVENDPRRCGIKPAPRKCFDVAALTSRVQRHSRRSSRSTNLQPRSSSAAFD